MFDKLIDTVLVPIWRFITPAHWINPWEGGVRITFGITWLFRCEAVKALGPGIHLKLPGFQRINQTTVASQTLNLPAQSLRTKDGVRVNVRGVVPYHVKSVVPFFTKIYDQDDYLRDRSLGAVALVVTTTTFVEQQDIVTICDRIATEIKKSVRGEGFGIEGFRWADHQESKALRLMMDQVDQ